MALVEFFKQAVKDAKPTQSKAPAPVMGPPAPTQSFQPTPTKAPAPTVKIIPQTPATGLASFVGPPAPTQSFAPVYGPPVPTKEETNKAYKERNDRLVNEVKNADYTKLAKLGLKGWWEGVAYVGSQIDKGFGFASEKRKAEADARYANALRTLEYYIPDTATGVVEKTAYGLGSSIPNLTLTVASSGGIAALGEGVAAKTALGKIAQFSLAAADTGVAFSVPNLITENRSVQRFAEDFLTGSTFYGAGQLLNKVGAGLFGYATTGQRLLNIQGQGMVNAIQAHNEGRNTEDVLVAYLQGAILEIGMGTTKKQNREILNQRIAQGVGMKKTDFIKTNGKVNLEAVRSLAKTLAKGGTAPGFVDLNAFSGKEDYPSEPEGKPEQDGKIDSGPTPWDTKPEDYSSQPVKPKRKLTPDQREFLNTVGEDYTTIDKYHKEAVSRYKSMIEQEVQVLQAQGKKGVQPGFLMQNDQGDVVGRVGRQSNNPEWYRALYRKNGRTPTMKDLRGLAEERLSKGYEEDGITVDPNEEFVALKDVAENISQIKETGVLVDSRMEDYPDVSRPAINRLTGVTPEKSKVTVFEPAALKAKLRAEAKAATEGYRQGRGEQKVMDKVKSRVMDIVKTADIRAKVKEGLDVRDQIVQYAKENLNKQDQGEVLSRLPAAHTQKNLENAMDYIERRGEIHERRNIVAKFKGITKKLDGMKSVDPQYRKEIKDIAGKYTKAMDTEGVSTDALRSAAAEVDRLVSEGRESRTETKFRYDLDKAQRLVQVMDNSKAAKIDSSAFHFDELGKPVEPSRVSKIKDWLRKSAQVVKSPDLMFESMDGTQDGPVRKVIFQKTRDAVKRGERFSNTELTKLEAIVKKHDLSEAQRREIGIKYGWGNENTRAKLKSQGVTQEKVDSITLSKGQQELLDAYVDHHNRTWEETNKVVQDLDSVNLGKEENYISMIPPRNIRDAQEKVFQPVALETVYSGAEQLGYTKNPKKNVERGFTYERTGDVNHPMETDILQIAQVIWPKEAMLIHAGRDIRMSQEIAGTDAFREVYGDVNQTLTRSWLAFTANGKKSTKAGDHFMETVNRRFQVFKLGLRLTTAVLQKVSSPQIIGQGISPINWVKGEILSKRSVGRKVAEQSSDYMDRSAQLVESYGEAKQGKPTKIAMFLTRAMDLDTYRSNYNAALYQWHDEMGIPFDPYQDVPEEAILYAEDKVRRAQGASSSLDVPLAFTQGEGLFGAKWLNNSMAMFQKFTLGTATENIMSVKRAIKTGQFGPAARLVFMTALTTAMGTLARVELGQATDYVFQQFMGDTDKPEEEKPLAPKIVTDLMNIYVPFATVFTNAINYTEVGPVPLESIFQALDDLQDARKAVEDAGGANMETFKKQAVQDKILYALSNFGGGIDVYLRQIAKRNAPESTKITNRLEAKRTEENAPYVEAAQKAIDAVKSGKLTPQQVEERIAKLPEDQRKKVVAEIKKLKTKEKSATTKKGKADMLPYYVQLMKLRQSDPAKAQEIWNRITPENKKSLNALIKQYNGMIP